MHNLTLVIPAKYEVFTLPTVLKELKKLNFYQKLNITSKNILSRLKRK